MDESIALTQLDEKRFNLARQRISAFHNRFGEGHLYLAYHAAFPMALTPDLLYRLRANFQFDNNKQPLGIRWIAVADLLLSNVCEEVEYELYQMKADVRSVLLHDLKNDSKFGSKRMKELASFLLDYVEQQMNNEAPALVQVQRWMALPYLDPTRAARELALALQEKLRQNNRGEVLRMASLVETFADPLKEMLPEYTPLVVYAQHAAQIVRGEGKRAVVQPSMEMGQMQPTRVFGVDLPMLGHLRQDLREKAEQPQTVRKDFFISYHEADRAWAEWIAWQLDEAGYSVLLRVWSFQPDANFQEEMALASQEAECMIVLFSQNYLNALSSMPSDWRTGLLLSPNRHLLQLSIRVGDCNPDILGAINYVDLVGLDESIAIEQLLSFVRSESAEVVKPSGSSSGIQRSVAEQPQFPGTLDAGEAERTIEVFFSYSHKDQHLRNQLETQLNLLQGLGLIADWYDHKIGPGQEWADQINAHIRTAQIILLLVSPDFIASPYCYDVEMKIALERHERGEARVILILLRPVDLEGLPFAKLRVLPSNGRSLTAWRNRDKAFLNIVRGIQNAIEELTRRPLVGSSSAEQGLEELQKTDDSPDNSPAIVASYAEEALWEELIDVIQLSMQPAARAMATASTLRQLSKLIPTDVALADLILGWRALSHAVHQDEEPATAQRRVTCSELADLASQFTADQGNLALAIRTWKVWLDAFDNSGDPRQAAMARTFRRELEELQDRKLHEQQTFDVFLCYNSADREAVEKIGEELISHGIRPWLDVWELRPGLQWQQVLEKQIDEFKTAAVFVGKGGILPWQQMEMEAFLREFVASGSPAIPVLLLDAVKKPVLPDFLRGMHWVDFRKDEPEPMEQLVWGITGKEPEATYEGELIRNHALETFIDIEQVAVNNISEEEAFIKLAQAINQFPSKQRAALLIDLANRMSFDAELTSLQKAFLDVGIQLRDYQKLLPNDPVERSRHAALLSIAYKRLRGILDR